MDEKTAMLIPFKFYLGQTVALRKDGKLGRVKSLCYDINGQSFVVEDDCTGKTIKYREFELEDYHNGVD